MTFTELHQQERPLLIGNVWDARSAAIAAELDFQALGTSSAAMASMLGYGDGEQMSFTEMESLIQAIQRGAELPLSVDLEAGYSQRAEEVAAHVAQLATMGVVGINIEDSRVEHNRHLVEAEAFADLIAEVKHILKSKEIDIFINVRTDAFLLGHSNALKEAQRRTALYEKAGADGIFTPCIVKAHDIAAMVDSTSLPLNVMCMPDLPDFETLQKLGVKRISMGNFLFDKMYQDLKGLMEKVLSSASFKPVF